MGLRLPPRIRMNPRLEDPLLAKPRPSLAPVSNYGKRYAERTVQSLFHSKPVPEAGPELRSCELCVGRVSLGSPGTRREAIVSETSTQCGSCCRYVCPDCARECENCASTCCHLCVRTTYQREKTATLCEKCSL